MGKIMVAVIASVWLAGLGPAGQANQSAGLETGDSARSWPIGKPGQSARYLVKAEKELPGSSIKGFVISLGPIEERESQSFQWIALEARKVVGGQLRVWVLAREYPPESIEEARPAISRYILQERDSSPGSFKIESAEKLSCRRWAGGIISGRAGVRVEAFKNCFQRPPVTLGKTINARRSRREPASPRRRICG